MLSKEIVERALLVVGAFVVASNAIKIAYELIKVFRLYFWSQFFFRANFIKKYGKWAVVTGATDGIGQAMAHVLAQQGHSIVVIGRNETKLRNTKRALEKEPNAGEIVTIKIDLSDTSVENFESIREELDPDNRDIGILINNAGCVTSGTKFFHKCGMNEIRQLINVNVIATTYMARMILPGMLERGKGLILNNSSLIGVLPGNHVQCYAQTKAYVDSFSKQLAVEYYYTPIDIINLTPGPVLTAMYVALGMRASRFIPTPDVFARSAIRAISTGIWTYCGCLWHEIIYILFKFTMPTWFYAITAIPTLKTWGVDTREILRDIKELYKSKR